MAINLMDYFELASLAEASYAHFNDHSIEKDALIEEKFSDTQADALLDNWTIFENGHQPNTSNGFSSTLFQNKNDNSFALAFRGHIKFPLMLFLCKSIFNNLYIT